MVPQSTASGAGRAAGSVEGAKSGRFDTSAAAPLRAASTLTPMATSDLQDVEGKQ
jgi:hypothetical protein